MREEAGWEHDPLSETIVEWGALSIDSTHRILRLDIGTGPDRRVQFGQVALVREVEQLPVVHSSRCLHILECLHDRRKTSLFGQLKRCVAILSEEGRHGEGGDGW